MTNSETRVFSPPEIKEAETFTVTLTREQVDSLERAMVTHRGDIMDRYINRRGPFTNNDRTDITSFDQLKKVFPPKKKP